MMRKLEGKVALITGGSSGIGRACAALFAAEGALVFITGRRQAQLDAAVQRVDADVRARVRAIQGDAGSEADLDRLFAAIRGETGRLDIVMANAAAQASAPVGAIDLADYARVFDINVRGTLMTVQKALPLMAGGGAVILTSSVAAVKGNPSRSVYAASKAAVRSFARSWASDLRGAGIRVNALTPGPTDTAAFEAPGRTPGQLAEIKARMGAGVPLGRIAQAQEIAKAALFLASDDSSYMTGAELFVDGGLAQM